ncbi:MAG: glycosyltransferase [Dysgonamonadaceae bacterium]|jgi:glycosyltransferase involved in cell wall biosynthesis|nr:glycosyltransferase [Dysgonamonadaceae bacterium]
MMIIFDAIHAMDTKGIVLLSLLFVFLIIQLVYYWFYLAKPYYLRKAIEKGKIVQPSSQPPVSVIICASNEYQNLEVFLPVILEQNYPLYEVIFVDDNSVDGTAELLSRLAFRYKHLYHTYIPEGSKNLSRRKLGLTLGIKAAKYDTLLFTGADCHPDGPDWISCMARHFTEKNSIVLGFSSFEKYPSRYTAYDYFFSNLQMVALALKGRPYTGNGRNLSYDKNWFVQQKGFSNSNFLDFGEDDLFINKIARKDNLAVELTPQSVIHVKMADYATWKDLKTGRMITRKYFKPFSVNFWGMEKISRILFFALLLLNILWFTPNGMLLGTAFFLFSVRLFTQLFVINKVAGLLKLPKFYFTLVLFDFIQPFVDEYFYLYSTFRRRKDYNWKYERR